MYWAIAAVCKYNPDVVSGYIIYNDITKATNYMDENNIRSFIKAGNRVENLAIGVNKLMGTMGKLDRLTKLNIRGEAVTREAYIIVSYNGEKDADKRVYRVVNYLGNEAYLSSRELIKLGEINAICNGKLVSHKNGKKYIAPICGKFLVTGEAKNHYKHHSDYGSYIKKFRLPNKFSGKKALNVRQFSYQEFYEQYFDVFELADNKQAIFKRLNGLKDFGNYFQDILIYKINTYEIEFDIFEIDHNGTRMFVVKSLSKTFIVHDIIHVGSRYTRLLKRGDDNSTDAKIVMLGTIGLIVISGLISDKANKRLFEIRVEPYSNLIENMQEKIKNIDINLDNEDINRIAYIAKRELKDVSYRRFNQSDLKTFTTKVAGISGQEQFGVLAVRKVINKQKMTDLQLYEGDDILNIAYANELKEIEIPGELGVIRSPSILRTELVNHCSLSLSPSSYSTIGNISLNNIEIQHIGMWAAYKNGVIKDITKIPVSKDDVSWLEVYGNICESPKNTIIVEVCGTIFVFDTEKIIELYRAEQSYIANNSKNIQALRAKLAMFNVNNIRISTDGYIDDWERITNEIRVPRYIRGIKCSEENWRALSIRPSGLLNTIVNSDSLVPYRIQSEIHTHITMIYNKDTLDIMEKQLELSFRTNKIYNKYIFDVECASVDDIDRVVSLGEAEVVIMLNRSGIIEGSIEPGSDSKLKLVNIIEAILGYQRKVFDFSLFNMDSLRKTSIKIRSNDKAKLAAELEKYFVDCANELSKLKIADIEFRLLANAIKSIIPATAEYNSIRDSITEKHRDIIK